MDTSLNLIGKTTSKNRVPIRLTKERWAHITTAHPEIAFSDVAFTLETVESPDIILAGDKDELLAIKKKIRKKAWFVVVYKEVILTDGFILTAYVTTDERWLFRRKTVWTKIS